MGLGLPVAIGEIVAGRYVVRHVLGEGGMGVVFAAWHRELDIPVAIKCLRPEIAEHGVSAERFRREARAVASFRSEHICRVLDVGTLPSGASYMVMEYLDGCDLAQYLVQRGRLRYPEAVAYLLQVCDALSEAHGAGLIHRDLKPANIFVERRSTGVSRVKVLDFGVSKSIDPQLQQPALTRTANLVGSPLYMSPEQLDSPREVDTRTDIWALGVVAYELITGQPPFLGSSMPRLVTAVLNEDPAPMDADGSLQLPAEVEDCIRRMLCKDRAERPASVHEIMTVLEPYAARSTGSTTMQRTTQPDTKSSGSSSSKETQVTTTPTVLSLDRAGPGVRRNLRRAALVGLVVVAAIAALLFQRAYDRHLAQQPLARPAQTVPLETQMQTRIGAATDPTPTRPETPGIVADEPAEQLPAGVADVASEPVPAERHDAGIATQKPGTQSVRALQPVPETKPTAVDQPAQAPASTPRASRSPAAPAPKPTSKRGRGLPPRGQLSDFGGRR